AVEEFKKTFRFLGILRQRREGKIAVVGLGFTNAQEKISRTVEVKMRNKGGYWQVAELSNLTELVKKVKADEQERMAQRNAPILERIAKTIEIAEFSKESKTGKYGIGQKVVIKMKVRNLGDGALLGYSAAIRPKDATGKVLKE